MGVAALPNVTEAETYMDAAPFPHIMFDNFFPEDRIKKVLAEISAAKIDSEAPGYGWLGKRRASDLEQFPPETRKLVEEMNAQAFLEWLGRLTGIKDLQPDPYLEGAGIHQIPPGGFLKVHTDFNWHKRLSLHRRLNAILYLNEDWDDAWGGHLELWDETELKSARGAPHVRIAPIFNRLVVFSTTDFSYHGHPDKLDCPPDRTRNSIALYYYTETRPESDLKFGDTTLTNYRERSGEKLGLKHKIHQSLLQYPIIRKIIGRY